MYGTTYFLRIKKSLKISIFFLQNKVNDGLNSYYFQLTTEKEEEGIKE